MNNNIKHKKNGDFEVTPGEGFFSDDRKNFESFEEHKSKMDKMIKKYNKENGTNYKHQIEMIHGLVGKKIHPVEIINIFKRLMESL